ncbi:putative peptidase (DUF1758) [Popillia japonica]|uniref:Peptidase (DUF1758) n=1 Tax=Popillia japonica TaxID=7064 RepID=A0AAW1JR47_POPJA
MDKPPLVRALKALQEPVEHWDTVLIYILTGKLDGKTRRDWEIHVGDDKNSTFKDLIEFLSNRCQILEMSDKCIELADTSFHNAGPIDILLGATIFFEILCKNQILLGKDKPILQETLFGWIVAGSIQVQNQKQVTSLLCNEQELQDQLRMFWEIEEPSVQKIKYSHEEEECLKYFNETTTRDETETGQFVVKMPLKDNIEQLGDTYDVALRKFIAKHSVALTADVEKMYRKVWIHESERHLQQIIWRENQESPISIYQLNTVTYGQAAAPFLAIRSLVQTAIDNEDRNPVACDVIKNDFYVDDLLSGAENENLAYDLFNENENLAYDLFNGVSNILASANFTLRKWNSNDLNVLKKISETRKEQEDKVYVGLVSPVTVLAKVFMQKLWENKVDWDQALPNHLCSEWHNVIKSMHAVNMIRAPRYLVCTDTSSNELHCFSDASEKAYAACIYLKTTEPNGSCNVNLVCAKTKVAPLKSLTIPRLELCGALLLTRLTVKTVSALKLTISRTIYWTDSTIVFGSCNVNLVCAKTKVAPLKSLTIPRLELCGALLLTRLTVKTGPSPSWLSQEDTNWPITNYVKQNTLEMKEVQTCHVLETTQDIFARFSTITKLVRVVSYILRFKINCLASKHQKTLGPLTTAELNRTLTMLIKLSQQESFVDDNDIVQLTKKHQLSRKSKLIMLNPFIDESGVMRVYGRLQNSQFNENKKFPLILAIHR